MNARRDNNLSSLGQVVDLARAVSGLSDVGQVADLAYFPAALPHRAGRRLCRQRQSFTLILPFPGLFRSEPDPHRTA